MEDKTLLELAAKAAGIEGEWRDVVRSRIAEYKTIKHTKHIGFFVDGKEWNPLTDDGDALRLAVKLGLIIELKATHVYVINAKVEIIGEDYNDDPYAATRRAIVRAAAEIGKASDV